MLLDLNKRKHLVFSKNNVYGNFKMFFQKWVVEKTFGSGSGSCPDPVVATDPTQNCMGIIKRFSKMGIKKSGSGSCSGSGCCHGDVNFSVKCDLDKIRYGN